jgi:cytochrome c5
LRDADQQFFDSFLLVLGILIGVAITLFIIVRMIAIGTQGQFVLEDADVIAEIDARIAPVGQVALAGSGELAALQAAAQSAPIATPESVDAPLTGPQVYNAACIACHAPPGIGGAPALGDNTAWAARLAQGMDLLVDHAINGFQGTAAVPMPPKGGRPDLSDQEVADAVEYMLGQVSQ